MNLKKMYDKVISREWCLLFSQDLHVAYTKLMKQKFGWGYSENLFEGKQGVVSIYRIKKEYTEELPKHILKKIAKNKEWFPQECALLVDKVNSVSQFINFLKKKTIATSSSKELKKILVTVSDMNRDFHPFYNIVLWFPISIEGRRSSERYKPLLDLAVATRKKIQDIEPRINKFYQEMLMKLLETSSMNPAYWKYLSREDCLALLKQKELDDKQLNLRKKYFIITTEGILNEPLKNFLDRKKYFLQSPNNQISTKIIGKSASPGIVSGYARVIMGKSMFKDIKKGEILIAPMTTADFTQVLKKVSAIVTDEGGITSHAAVISREMYIPCVVGTGNATAVFRTGDFLRVNANEGIVEKLLIRS